MKKNNKGFTLVELIVVIAILGVLMAVLVPQYIQYVEKSREATDLNTLSEILHSCEITAASQENLTEGTFTITLTSGVISYDAGGEAGEVSAAFVNEIKAICPGGTLKSTDGKELTSLVIDVAADGTEWHGTAATNTDSAAAVDTLRDGKKTA